MAPKDVCTGQTKVSASASAQERTMRCMINYARRKSESRPLDNTPVLDRSARHKSTDILRCQSFSHTACGRSFTYWMDRLGYAHGCHDAGENIAWGSGRYATVRSIMRTWVNSAGHRRNMLSPTFTDLGVGLRVGRLEGADGAHVWTTHFGDPC